SEGSREGLGRQGIHTRGIDDQPATRQEPLSLNLKESAQEGSRNAYHLGTRAGVRQTEDSGVVPQRHRMGGWYLWSRGGVATLFRCIGVGARTRPGSFLIGDHSESEGRLKSDNQ